jgi:3-oxoacyl-[acyl-carrier protein] reductase
VRTGPRRSHHQYLFGFAFRQFRAEQLRCGKGAIASLTYTWAIELARHGIGSCDLSGRGNAMTQGIISGPDAEQAEIFWAPERNSPLLVYLASDEAANVSGQIFGTGGERLAHMVQRIAARPSPRREAGRWQRCANNQQQIPQEFGVFGISAKPYPFHAGVKAPGQELS